MTANSETSRSQEKGLDAISRVCRATRSQEKEVNLHIGYSGHIYSSDIEFFMVHLLAETLFFIAVDQTQPDRAKASAKSAI